MAQVQFLAPHDPLPDSHSLVVLRRFDEDQPDRTVIDLVLRTAGGAGHTTRARNPDGTPMTLDQALARAQSVAAGEGLDTVWHIDRTAGPLERDVLRHRGDHSFRGEPLDDTDLEDGEPGTDMRDRGNDGGPRRF